MVAAVALEAGAVDDVLPSAVHVAGEHPRTDLGRGALGGFDAHRVDPLGVARRFADEDQPPGRRVVAASQTPRSLAADEHEHGTWDDGRLRNKDVLFVELAGCVRRRGARTSLARNAVTPVGFGLR